MGRKGIFEIDEDFGSGENRDVVGTAISHVDDLLISGAVGFILFHLNSWKMNAT